MADSFRSLLDFRSLTTNSNYNFRLYLPTKHYYPSAFLRSHNSRIKRKPFHLALLSKPSSQIDVVSTHEHSDGSLLFRFGDPSEVAKNVEIEESKNVEVGSETEDEPLDVKVSDSVREKEVAVKKADSDISGSSSTEVDNHTNSVIISDESRTVSEEESDLCEKLLEGSSDVELTVLISSTDAEIPSTGGVEVEHTENVDEGLYEKSPEMENSITTLELSENNATDTCISGVEIERNASQSDASVLENGYKTEDNDITTTLEVLENEAAEVATLDSLILDPVSVGPDSEFLQVSADSSQSDASALENSSGMENYITTEELLENETAEVATSDFVVLDPVLVAPDYEVLHGSADLSPSDDAPSILGYNSEMEMYITTVELFKTEAADVTALDSSTPDPVTTVPENDDVFVDDERTNVKSDIEIEIVETDLAESERAITSLSEEIGDGNETDTAILGVQKAIVGNENGSSLNDTELVTESTQLEAESMFDEETTGIDTVEESKKDDGAEILTVDLTVGPEITEADDKAQSDDSVEESATTSILDSREIISTEFVLSSGAALLPHPSKVLTGGEDAYFIAGQTWLGVADGIGQWSFHGTETGVYAQELVKNCEMLISNCKGDSVNNPVELLKLGVSETGSAGSSAVLIARFDGQVLHVANIGDSGFIVLRRGNVYKRSSPMHHAFYFPRRIERGDDPSSLAELYSVDLEEEDVIITATDGLLDNLYDREISSIVDKSLADDKKPEELAELLAREAQERGGSAFGRSPFGDDAEVAGFTEYTGGKIDDVAVIVSVVGRKSESRNL
ncbi:hypothetical protein ABFS83_02G061100 [Erythranthe nasuta]